MRTRKVPSGARHLRAYAELESYLRDFVQGVYLFLWVFGRPGTAETESIKAALRGRNCYYRKAGQLTPLQFYKDLYFHRGQPVILDDAEHLLENKIGAKLISSLGESTPVKLLSYASTTRGLGEVPQSYYTTSPLCILANRVTAHEYLQSRGVILFWDPTSREVHQAVARWYWDQEIHTWFGQHLHRLQPLDTRWYVTADRDKRALRDWQQIVLQTHALDRASCVVQNLQNDPAYPTRKDKARRFVEILGNVKGASRATYFRLLRRLEDEQRLVVEPFPQIQLRRSHPPGTPSLLELDSLEVPFPEQPEEDPSPLDVPLREQFAQPVQGESALPTSPPRPALDGSLPWEVPPQVADEDEE